METGGGCGPVPVARCWVLREWVCPRCSCGLLALIRAVRGWGRGGLRGCVWVGPVVACPGVRGGVAPGPSVR